MHKNVSIIPKGHYCYDHLEHIGGGKIKVCGMCPYLEFIKDWPEDRNGYCHYLEKGDNDKDGTMLLWDMVKECGINCEKIEKIKFIEKLSHKKLCLNCGSEDIKISTRYGIYYEERICNKCNIHYLVKNKKKLIKN